MAYLKLNNIRSSIESIVENNIVTNSNSIKESYLNSNIYNQSKNSSNPNISLLSEEIKTQINSLSNEFQQFNNYLNDYINDYYLVNQYLTKGSLGEVKSVPTQSVLSSNPSIKNDELDKIKVINLNLVVNNEIKNKEKENHE